MKVAISFLLLILSTFCHAENITPCSENLQRIEGYDPKYPIREYRRPVDGWVVLTALLNPDGILQDIEILESEPDNLFDRSAVKAVRSWKFDWSGSWCKYKTRLRFKFNG
ncbi:energy transducer TonB [Microbulbifer sp. ANSA002]|uniref:energy transducer TonB n=1 Tax=unclassified Microbulbifer TaxID=2619833 RepID=UPI0040434880